MLTVKICGLTDATAIQTAVDAGADAIGFVFAKSVRQVSPELACKLAADLPPHVRKVAVMKNPRPDEWNDVQKIFQPDVLQTDAEDFDYLRVDASVEFWPVYREGKSEPRRNKSSCFLYEGKSSGSGETVDWNIAAGFAGYGRMMLAGGLSAENVGEAISVVRPWGVDVSSAVEATPGRKDPQMIRAFIRAVRNAENTKDVSV